MCKSFKLLKERNAKLRSNKDPIYIGIIVVIVMTLLNLFLPEIENFWLDALTKGVITGVIGTPAILLMYELRARKEKR